MLMAIGVVSAVGLQEGAATQGSHLSCTTVPTVPGSGKVKRLQAIETTHNEAIKTY